MAWLRWRCDAGDGQGQETCRVCQEARGERTWCGQCEAVELWPENIPSASLYIACETQWQRAGMSGLPVGLNYSGVEAAMRLRGDPPALFDDLQVLERVFLQIAADRASKEHHSAPRAH